MHITTHLDLDVIAVEGPEQVSLLVELTAPTVESAAEREPSTLVVVLDRSGSMAGERLEGAKHALITLVDRLDPTDRFGLVDLRRQRRAGRPRRPADRQGRRPRPDRGDPRRRHRPTCPRATCAACRKHVATAGPRRRHGPADQRRPRQRGRDRPGTAGRGRGQGLCQEHHHLDPGLRAGLRRERCSARSPRGGAGSELFAEHADEAVAAIAGEIDGLLSQSAQAASLLIRMRPACRGRTPGQRPARRPSPTTACWSSSARSTPARTRKLVLTFDVPGMPALGLAEIASLDFTWVELPGLVQHSVTVPVHVNVVPGDQAAGRIPDILGAHRAGLPGDPGREAAGDRPPQPRRDRRGAVRAAARPRHRDGGLRRLPRGHRRCARRSTWSACSFKKRSTGTSAARRSFRRPTRASSRAPGDGRLEHIRGDREHQPGHRPVVHRR